MLHTQQVVLVDDGGDLSGRWETLVQATIRIPFPLLVLCLVFPDLVVTQQHDDERIIIITRTNKKNAW